MTMRNLLHVIIIVVATMIPSTIFAIDTNDATRSLTQNKVNGCDDICLQLLDSMIRKEVTRQYETGINDKIKISFNDVEKNIIKEVNTHIYTIITIITFIVMFFVSVFTWAYQPNEVSKIRSEMSELNKRVNTIEGKCNDLMESRMEYSKEHQVSILESLLNIFSSR